MSRFAEEFLEFMEATMAAQVITEQLGLDEDVEVTRVAMNGVPEGWEKIVCTLCGAEGAVPAGTVPKDRQPVCPDCMRRVVEKLT